MWGWSITEASLGGEWELFPFQGSFQDFMVPGPFAGLGMCPVLPSWTKSWNDPTGAIFSCLKSSPPQTDPGIRGEEGAP